MKIATILLIAVIATALAAIQILSTIGDSHTVEAGKHCGHGHGHGHRHGGGGDHPKHGGGGDGPDR